jgi:hypothetical protein
MLQKLRTARGQFVLFLTMVALSIPAASFAQVSLDINLDPLWTNVNAQFPVFLAVVAIPGAISIALIIANMIIDKVRDAFR